MNRTTYIPREIECFWCGKRMIRGTVFSSSSINHVSYFCEECGAVSHFAVHNNKKISSIEVEYKATKEGDEE